MHVRNISNGLISPRRKGGGKKGMGEKGRRTGVKNKGKESEEENERSQERRVGLT